MSSGSKTSEMMRIHKNFIKELEGIKVSRIRKGIDKPTKPKTYPRITLAITRHPLFPRIKEDILNDPLK